MHEMSCRSCWNGKWGRGRPGLHGIHLGSVWWRDAADLEHVEAAAAGARCRLAPRCVSGHSTERRCCHAQRGAVPLLASITVAC